MTASPPAWPPDVLVQLCQHQRAGPGGAYAPGWIRVSANGGASYGPGETLPAIEHPAGDGSDDQVAAASAGRMLVTENSAAGSQVLLTGNGGVSWATVLRLPASAPAVLVGFEDPLTARVAQGDHLWTTRDGGRTWVSSQF